MGQLFDFNIFLLVRLVAAVVCGGLIGWERGGTRHEAGLRTHIIVCLGAATIMVISECMVEKYHINGEIMRMGAQIVSGIGFLGAGSIIVDGNRIRGITTAAGIWTTACIGIAIGAGYYVISFFVVILMLFTMLGLRSVTKRLKNKNLNYTLKITIRDNDLLKDTLAQLAKQDISIKNIRTEINENRTVAIVSITIPNSIDIDTVMYELGSKPQISELTII